MNKSNLNEFQESVTEVLIRHKSILDVITKLQESCARVNRAIVKSASDCGCIQINGKIQDVPLGISYEEIQQFLSNHVTGSLCEVCKEKVAEELGNHLFYVTAVCGSLDLNLENILDKQLNNIKALGKFSLY